MNGEPGKSEALSEDTKAIDVVIDEMRAACQKAADHYFGLRPQLLRTAAEESIFRAGFEHAWHDLWRPSMTDNSDETVDALSCPKCDGSPVEALTQDGKLYYWHCFNDGRGWEDCDFPDGPKRETSGAALRAWNEHVRKY